MDGEYIILIAGTVLGSNALIIGFLTKIYYKLGAHTRDIKYIKQYVGMNRCQEVDRNGLENDRP